MSMAKKDFDDVVTAVKQFESSWLRDLQTILAAELKTREKEDIQKARLEIQRIAESVGVSVEHLLSTSTNRDGSPRKASSIKGRKIGVQPPKYVHPNDPKITWSGRGLTPRWISESGKPKEEFLISKDAS